MTDFTEELRETALRSQRRAEQARLKAQREREDKQRREAEELAATFDTDDLKKQMKTAALKGARRLTLVSSTWGKFTPEQTKLARAYSVWASQQGIRTYWEERGPSGSDDYTDGSEYMGVSW